MFCSSCGAQIPDGSAVCPNCGVSLSLGQKMNDAASDMANNARDAFSRAESSLAGEINDIQRNINQGQNQNMGGNGNMRLKTDRSLPMYILLTIVTCGIYSYYFVYQIAQDVNVACEGDGEQTSGLVAFILLSFITCGIYSWIWQYKLGNRLATNAPRYGLAFQENGTTILMWNIFGILLCGIGPFIAMHIIIKNSNAICAAYNQQHGAYGA